MLGTWTARQTLAADTTIDPNAGLPSAQPTVTAPAETTVDDTPVRRRGPKGLDWLAEPDGDPPDTT